MKLKLISLALLLGISAFGVTVDTHTVTSDQMISGTSGHAITAGTANYSTTSGSSVVSGSAAISGSAEESNYARGCTTASTLLDTSGENGYTANYFASSANLSAHSNRTDNPHAVTKAQVGLGSADNTSDANKPVSAATQAALDAKATAAQGAKADTALQPSDSGSRLTGITAAQIQGLKSIPNLAIWIEADTLAFADGATVATAADTSGSGNNLTQTDTSKQPTFVSNGINGNPALLFDGTNDLVTTGSTFFNSSWGSAYSLFIVCQKTVNTLTGIQALAANSNGRTNSEWWLGTQYPNIYFGVDETAPLANTVGEPDLTAPTIFGYTFDGLNHSCRINGMPSLSISSTNALTVSGVLTIGNAANGSFPWDGKIAAVIIFKRGLSTAETQKIEAYLKAKYIAPKRNLTMVGDSVVAGAASTAAAGNPPMLVANLLGGSRTWNINNLGVGGKTIAAVDADIAGQLVRYRIGSADDVVTVWGGSNDFFLHGANVADTYSHLVSACTKARLTGAKVIVATMLPRLSDATLETYRQSFNALIRANWPTFSDGLADVGGDATIGVSGAQNTSNFSSDHIHLSDTGYAIAANIFANGIRRALHWPIAGSVTLASGSATISDAGVTARAAVFFTLKSPSGTVSSAPYATVTSGTGFSVSAGSGDSSTYNYTVIEQ